VAVGNVRPHWARPKQSGVICFFFSERKPFVLHGLLRPLGKPGRDFPARPKATSQEGRFVNARVRADLQSLLFPVIPLAIVVYLLIIGLQHVFKGMLGFPVPAPLWALLFLIIFARIVKRYRKRSY
jgi:hypothetical protein